MTRNAEVALGEVMRHARAATRDGNVISSRLAPIGERETVGSLLARNASRFAERPAYRERRDGRLETVTWDQLLRDVVAFGRFLSASGVRAGERVAVISPNRGEVLVAELATMGIGAIYTPIFAGYAADQLQALVAHAEPAALLLAGASQLEQVGVPPSARTVVTFDPLPPGMTARAAPHLAFADAVRRGRSINGSMAEWLATAAAIDPGKPALMMYTSGTSGPLKGVLLSHDNILSQQRALSAIWDVTPDDRFLSYLPWHHSFGGIFEKYTALYHGAALCIDESLGKDFAVLLRNWKDVQPTIYFSVPKIYQQLVVHAQAHPDDEGRIFHEGLRFVFTAAAPLPATISAFFAARGIPVLEGWGLTETSPCCTLTDFNEPRAIAGMIGYPIPGVSIAVAPDGEILVRGSNVMSGYYRNPEATTRALPGDGWFHTGDLGEVHGVALKLVSRKDRVFKMLNAEKVIPTAIENRLAGMNPYIRHVIVTGSGRDFLAALIFPDYFRIHEEFGADVASAERVVKASLRESVLAFNREHSVKYEHIQAFVVVSKELSIEDEELTPSLKVRVGNVLENVGEYLEAVYEPSEGCDCRFLRTVMRLSPDERRCFAGSSLTLDQCHECGSFLFGDQPGAAGLA
ncbi:MAG TPA: AMP-binding protein [Gemmatimonadaceae bacterium]